MDKLSHWKKQERHQYTGWNPVWSLQTKKVPFTYKNTERAQCALIGPRGEILLATFGTPDFSKVTTIKKPSTKKT